MRKRAGFTIIEVLVASAVVVVLAGLLVFVLRQVASALGQARSTAQEFESAQRAFDRLVRRIGSATLNSHHKNVPLEGWRPVSELRFASGQMQTFGRSSAQRVGHGVFFSGPNDRRGYGSDARLTGADGLLHTWGYFVEVVAEKKPRFLEGVTPARICPKLMELNVVPSESGEYGAAGDSAEWVAELLGNGKREFPSYPVTANIAALVIRPRISRAQPSELSPGYLYDSVQKGPIPTLDMRHRLPPELEITMVALDDATVAENYSETVPDPFGVADLFVDAASLDSDLEKLESALLARRAKYRIFTTVISPHPPL